MISNTPSGFVPAWIGEKIEQKTPIQKALLFMQSMSAKTENAWRVGTVVIQIALTGLLANAVWTVKTLANHESRINAAEEWKKDKGPMIEELRREFVGMRERSAAMAEQVRATDLIVREISARFAVVTDTMIRIQEGQAAIKEKMVAIQVAQDDSKK